MSVVLPAMTETSALDLTVQVLHETCDPLIEEMLFVVSARTEPDTLERCWAARERFGARVRVILQGRPYLGGAMRDAFEAAVGSRILLMSTDLETDPRLARRMIDISVANPDAIVTASRWAEGGGFTGYGRLRVAANWLFNRAVSILYKTHVTDATFGYRVIPLSVIRAIEWRGERHELLLESILKPLRLGVEVVEVPAHWRPRTEGVSQNSLVTQLRYVTTMLATRWEPRSSFARGWGARR